MVQKVFYLPFSQYRNLLKPAMVDEGLAERVTNPEVINGNVEFYHLKGLGASLLYSGKGLATIAGNSEDSIKRAKSKLEKISGARLAETKFKQNG